VNTTPWPLYLRERDPVAIVQEAGWGLRASLDEVENLTAIRIRSVDCQACRKSSNALCNLRVSIFEGYDYHGEVNWTRRKEVLMALFKILPSHFPGGIEENQVRIASQDHLNAKQKSFVAV